MRKMAGAFCICMLVLSACKYHNEDDLYPSCNTNNISFSGTVTQLLTSYGCIGCHNNSVPTARVNLETHLGTVEATQNGRLLGAISHASGFKPMPQGGRKMSDCEISKIKAWIDAGKPNN